MNKFLTSAALLGMLAATSATAEDMPKAKSGNVKCFGIAKAGKNDCMASDGSNSCAGSSKRDNDKHDWAFASAEDCKAQGGSEAAPAN